MSLCSNDQCVGNLWWRKSEANPTRYSYEDSGKLAINVENDNGEECFYLWGLDDLELKEKSCTKKYGFVCVHECS